MNASEQLHRVLSDATGVQALATVVRPTYLAQGDTLPAVVYQIISTNPTGSLAGDTGNLDRVRAQIDCWAASYAEAVNLAAAVRNALRPHPTLADGTTLRARFIDSRTDYNEETRRHRVSSDFHLWQTL